MAQKVCVLRTIVLAIGSCLLSAFAARAETTVSLLHTFAPLAPDGAYPWSTLIQGADGNFYGMAASGGQLGSGNIFQVAPSGILTVSNQKPSHRLRWVALPRSCRNAILCPARGGNLAGIRSTVSLGWLEFSAAWHLRRRPDVIEVGSRNAPS